MNPNLTEPTTQTSRDEGMTVLEKVMVALFFVLIGASVVLVVWN